MMINMVASNIKMSSTNRIISDLQSCTEESSPGPKASAVLTATAMALAKYAGEKMISKLVKDAVSQTMTGQDVISTIAHKLVDPNELTALIARFGGRTVEEKACTVRSV